METKWVRKLDVAGEGNYSITDISSHKETCVTGAYWTDDIGPYCITAHYGEDGELVWHAVYQSHDFRATQGKSVLLLQTEQGLIETEKGVYVHIQTTSKAGLRGSALIKYDTLGNLLWERFIQKAADESELHSTMVADYAGNIYITGLRADANDAVSIFITKFNNSGEKLWSTSYYNPNLRFRYVKCDVMRPDQFLIGGVLEENRDLCFMRYDSIGTLVSISRYETLEYEDELADMKIDMQGNVYMAGARTRSESGKDYLTVVHDKKNNLLWAQHFDGQAHLDDIPKDMVVDDSSNVYVTGSSKNETGTTDIITIKYDKNGNELWTTTYKGKKNESAEPYIIGAEFLHYYGYKDILTFSITGSVGGDVAFLIHNINGFYSWTTRYKGKGQTSRPTALSGDCIAVESITGDRIDATIVKYGKAEQFGIVRWD